MTHPWESGPDAAATLEDLDLVIEWLPELERRERERWLQYQAHLDALHERLAGTMVLPERERLEVDGA